jgi:hypothetical protein
MSSIREKGKHHRAKWLIGHKNTLEIEAGIETRFEMFEALNR